MGEKFQAPVLDPLLLMCVCEHFGGVHGCLGCLRQQTWLPRHGLGLLGFACSAEHQRGLAGPRDLPGQGECLSCSWQPELFLPGTPSAELRRLPSTSLTPRDQEHSRDLAWQIGHLPSFPQDCFTAAAQLRTFSVPMSLLCALIPSLCPCPVPVTMFLLHALLSSPVSSGSRRMSPD